MVDDLNQTPEFTIPLKQEQMAVVIMLQTIYLAILYEQENKAGKSTDALLEKNRGIMDKLKEAKTTGSVTLVHNEMMTVYEALYIMRRLTPTKAVQNLLAELYANQDAGLVEDTSNYFIETCTELLSFCHETFCNNPFFQSIKNTVELEFERQN